MKIVLEDKEKKKIAKLKTGKDVKSRPKKLSKKRRTNLTREKFYKKVPQRMKMKSSFVTMTVMTN